MSFRNYGRKNAGKRKSNQYKANRIGVAIVILALAFLVILWNLFYLQIINAENKHIGQLDQLIDEVSVEANRGNIYDRNKSLLVKDSSASTVNVIPYNVKDPKKIAEELSSVFGLNYDDVYKKATQIEDDLVDVITVYDAEKGKKVVELDPEAYVYKNKTVYVYPNKVKNPEEDTKKIMDLVSDLPEEKYDVIYKRLTLKENSHVFVENKVDNLTAKKIKDDQCIKNEKGDVVSYNGLALTEDKKRYYTNGNFASHLLGFTGKDHTGLSGVENTYNDWLKGENGIAYFVRDAEGNYLPSELKTIKKPVAGKDLVLTIDTNIQIIAEKNLSIAVEQWKARSGTAIVMDSKTGEILAMATKPDYNLNTPFAIDPGYAAKNPDDGKGKSESDKLQEMWNNPAINFVFEPGSTFKAVTGASALEEGVVNPQTKVHCDGYIVVNGVTINCTGVHGTQTVSEAISNSCNPGLVQIIQKLDPKLFYQYVYNFGFGKATKIELPGEESGIVNRAFDGDGNINLLDYSTFSFGQGLATTPIQLLSALNSVVNNGYYMDPTIISKESKEKKVGTVVGNSPKQIISTDTSGEMRQIMKMVIDNNSYLSSLSEGYSIGGKTGTAEKFIDGEYSKTLHVTSFFSYAPVEDPKYSIIVLLDEPLSNAFGGSSAAPVAITLMKQVLDYMGGKNDVNTNVQLGKTIVPDLIGQDIGFAEELLKEKGIHYEVLNQTEGNIILSQSLEPLSSYDNSAKLQLTVGSQDNGNDMVVVPNLKGMSIQAVNEMIYGLGLNLKVIGSGFAIEQSPAGGTKVKRGSEIVVTFGQ